MLMDSDPDIPFTFSDRHGGIRHVKHTAVGTTMLHRHRLLDPRFRSKIKRHIFSDCGRCGGSNDGITKLACGGMADLYM
jgi:hypothetical protein